MCQLFNKFFLSYTGIGYQTFNASNAGQNQVNKLKLIFVFVKFFKNFQFIHLLNLFSFFSNKIHQLHKMCKLNLNKIHHNRKHHNNKMLSNSKHNRIKIKINYQNLVETLLIFQIVRVFLKNLPKLINFAMPRNGIFKKYYYNNVEICFQHNQHIQHLL